MTSTIGSPDTYDNLTAWNKNASFWSDYRGSPRDAFYTFLEQPILDQYCNPDAGKRFLELCAGTGQWARHAAAEGASVMVTDASPDMLEASMARSKNDGRLKFHLLNVMDLAAIQSFATKASFLIFSKARHNAYGNVQSSMEDLTQSSSTCP